MFPLPAHDPCRAAAVNSWQGEAQYKGFSIGAQCRCNASCPPELARGTATQVTLHPPHCPGLLCPIPWTHSTLELKVQSLAAETSERKVGFELSQVWQEKGSVPE